MAQLLGGQTLSEYEVTRRSRVRQIREYARYDAETVRGVLDAGLVFCAGDMGWSWQKPTTRERERDEAAIERWVETTWSAVEETPPAR